MRGEQKALLSITALEEEGVLEALPGPGEQGWGTSPPFLLLENGSVQEDHPLWKL